MSKESPNDDPYDWESVELDDMSTAPLENWKEVAQGISSVAQGVGNAEGVRGRALSKRVKERMVIEKEKVMPHWRKVVTGSKKKRIRDYIKEETGHLRVDEFAFTVGVLAMLMTQYILLVWKGYFWLWYILLTPLLFGFRIWQYSSLGYGYFLYDFCYFATILCLIGVILFPENAFLYRVNFGFAAGPLGWACVLWRNSLVFHSIDKITSVFLHFMPGLLMIDWRWSCSNEDASSALVRKMSCNAVDAPDESWLWSFIVWPCAVYLVWQTFYYIKTEVIDRQKLDDDPNLTTSLRWLALDTKNGMNQFVRKCMIRWGFFRKDEHFDPYTIKTKVIFISTQFVYTLATLSPIVLIHRSYTLHVLVYVYILVALVRNGAAYYIKIFSKRYRQQIQKNIRGAPEEVARRGGSLATAANIARWKRKLSHNSEKEHPMCTK